MNKNRLFLAISVISLLVMGMAVFSPFSRKPSAATRDTGDFYQRHPDWTWTVNNQNAVVPITGEDAFPDYYQRHPELTIPAVIGSGASDYFQRHPELSAPAKSSVDTTDYFFRHPELASISESNVDLTDYYLRHINNRSLP
jgi:hypothetical protein